MEQRNDCDRCAMGGAAYIGNGSQLVIIFKGLRARTKQNFFSERNVCSFRRN
jgi:hypothetical protein